MEKITVGGEIPHCTECNSQYWTVVQIIRRESDLIKVDGLGDLHVEPPDQMLNACVLILRCKRCDALYQISDSLDAMNEKDPQEAALAQTQDLIEARIMRHIANENALDDEKNNKEAWSEGAEDGYGFPDRVANNPSMEVE